MDATLFYRKRMNDDKTPHQHYSNVNINSKANPRAPHYHMKFINIICASAMLWSVALASADKEQRKLFLRGKLESETKRKWESFGKGVEEAEKWVTSAWPKASRATPTTPPATLPGVATPTTPPATGTHCSFLEKSLLDVIPKFINIPDLVLGKEVTEVGVTYTPPELNVDNINVNNCLTFDNNKRELNIEADLTIHDGSIDFLSFNIPMPTITMKINAAVSFTACDGGWFGVTTGYKEFKAKSFEAKDVSIGQLDIPKLKALEPINEALVNLANGVKILPDTVGTCSR